MTEIHDALDHTFGDDALGTLDAVGVATAISEGDITTVEAVEAACARAAVVSETLNAVAFWHGDEAAAEAAALRSDAEFAGVPTVIKDNQDHRGIPTRHGSRGTGREPASANSPWVAQFLDMGVVSIAKSTMPEFGLTATTEPQFSGPTRNPWARDRSTGGSSGGSAALVAAGVVPFAHGNDGGGSIRIPAAACGIVGLKPSRGRIIDDPALDRSPLNIVAQGVLTRSVRDTAAYLAAAERRHQPAGLPPVGHVTTPGDERRRIGFYSTLAGGADSSPEVREALASTAALLESLGHEVIEIDNPITEQMGDDFLLYWGLAAQAMQTAGSALLNRPVDRRRLEPLTNGLAQQMRRNVHRVPGAIRRLRGAGAIYEATFASGGFDLLLTPTLAQAPVPLGTLGPDVEPADAIERLKGYVGFTPVHNVTGAPAISLPLARTTASVPIGMMLGAPIGEERRLLQVALEIEAAAPFVQMFDKS